MLFIKGSSWSGLEYSGYCIKRATFHCAKHWAVHWDTLCMRTLLLLHSKAVENSRKTLAFYFCRLNALDDSTATCNIHFSLVSHPFIVDWESITGAHFVISSKALRLEMKVSCGHRQLPHEWVSTNFTSLHFSLSWRMRMKSDEGGKSLIDWAEKSHFAICSRLIQHA